MTLYVLALFLHVVAVVALFAAIAIETIGLFRMRAATTVVMVREWSGLVERTGPVFAGTTVLLLITGMYMVAKEWSWQTAWADVALVALIALAVAGASINGPSVKQIHTTAHDAPDGLVPANLTRLINDVRLWTAVQTMAFATLGIVYLMTVKPDLVGSLVAMLVAILAGFASAQPTVRRAPGGRRSAGSARNRALPPDGQ